MWLADRPPPAIPPGSVRDDPESRDAWYPSLKNFATEIADLSSAFRHHRASLHQRLPFPETLRRLEQLLTSPEQLDLYFIFVHARHGRRLFHRMSFHFLQQNGCDPRPIRGPKVSPPDPAAP